MDISFNNKVSYCQLPTEHTEYRPTSIYLSITLLRIMMHGNNSYKFITFSKSSEMVPCFNEIFDLPYVKF